MTPKLKPLREQVIVITGASSGIGLCTARRAAKAGASVVLAARNERDLANAVAGIHRDGGRATYIVADVADAEEVDRIARTAIAKFGGFDTWVNNASTSIYGRLDEIDLADKRRLFDVNFWGVVHGCRSAVPHLRERGGGALINVGSVVSERAIPLLGIYGAAKHAVKAYTDALRMELEEEGSPISVSLVKPSSIDTPFFQHSKSYLGVEPLPVPPVYAPEVVADAILECAANPVRDIIVGGGGKMLAAMGYHAPRLTDKYLERTAFDQQRSDIPIDGRPDNLFAPVDDDGGERGRNWQGPVMESSLYTRAALNPAVAALAFAGAALALIAGGRAIRQARQAGAGGERLSDRAVAIPVDVEPRHADGGPEKQHGDKILPRDRDGTRREKGGAELDEPPSEGTTPPHGDVLPRKDQESQAGGRMNGDPYVLGPSR